MSDIRKSSDSKQKQVNTKEASRNISPTRLLRRPVEVKTQNNDEDIEYIMNGQKVDLSTIKMIPVPSRSTSPISDPESDSSTEDSPKNVLSDEGSPIKKPKTPSRAITPKETSVREEKPKTPSRVATPVAEEKPKTPSRTATPVIEEKPKTPSRTATPVIEEKPKTPSRTATPVKEEKPKTPSRTATPVAEEKPKTPSRVATPVKEEKPKTPSRVATPVAEEKPKTPSRTATPVKEEKSKTPSRVSVPIIEEKSKTPSGTPSRVATPIKEEKLKTPSRVSVPIVEEKPKTPIRGSSKSVTPIRESIPVEEKRKTPISSLERRGTGTPERDDNYILIQTHRRPSNILGRSASRVSTPEASEQRRMSIRQDETPKTAMRKLPSEMRSPKRVSIREHTPLPSPVPDWNLANRRKIATPINEDTEDEEIISKPILIDRFKVGSTRPSETKLKLATPKLNLNPQVQIFVEAQPPQEPTEPIEITRPLPKPVKMNVTPYTPSIPLFTAFETSEPDEVREEISRDKLKNEFDELIADNPGKKIEPFRPDKNPEVEKARLVNEVRKITVSDTVRYYQFWILLISMIIEVISSKIELDVTHFAQQQRDLMNKYEKILKRIADKSYGDFLDGLPPEAQLFGTMLFYFLMTIVIRYVVSFFKDKPEYVELCEKGFFYLLRGNDITDTRTGPNGESNEIANLLIKAVPFLKVFLGGKKEEPKVQEVPVESSHAD